MKIKLDTEFKFIDRLLDLEAGSTVEFYSDSPLDFQAISAEDFIEQCIERLKPLKLNLIFSSSLSEQEAIIKLKRALVEQGYKSSDDELTSAFAYPISCLALSETTPANKANQVLSQALSILSLPKDILELILMDDSRQLNNFALVSKYFYSISRSLFKKKNPGVLVNFNSGPKQPMPPAQLTSTVPKPTGFINTCKNYFFSAKRTPIEDKPAEKIKQSFLLEMSSDFSWDGYQQIIPLSDNFLVLFKQPMGNMPGSLELYQLSIENNQIEGPLATLDLDTGDDQKMLQKMLLAKIAIDDDKIAIAYYDKLSVDKSQSKNVWLGIYGIDKIHRSLKVISENIIASSAEQLMPQLIAEIDSKELFSTKNKSSHNAKIMLANLVIEIQKTYMPIESNSGLTLTHCFRHSNGILFGLGYISNDKVGGFDIYKFSLEDEQYYLSPIKLSPQEPSAPNIKDYEMLDMIEVDNYLIIVANKSNKIDFRNNNYGIETTFFKINLAHNTYESLSIEHPIMSEKCDDASISKYLVYLNRDKFAFVHSYGEKAKIFIYTSCLKHVQTIHLDEPISVKVGYRAVPHSKPTSSYLCCLSDGSLIYMAKEGLKLIKFDALELEQSPIYQAITKSPAP